MQIDSFEKVTFLYNTGPIPPPYCFKYNISILLNDRKDFGIIIKLEYYDRDEVSEEEIYNEGFSLDDDFQWEGNLPQVWGQEIIKKLNASNWKKQASANGEGPKLMVKLDYTDQSENLEPADMRSWEVFIQEIIQACLELSEREAPLYISFLWRETKRALQQLDFKYSFAQRSVNFSTTQKGQDSMSWSDGQKLLKYIFGIDYFPENGFEKIPAKNGAFISPGDGMWYQLDATENSGQKTSKEKKLVEFFLPYLD